MFHQLKNLFWNAQFFCPIRRGVVFFSSGLILTPFCKKGKYSSRWKCKNVIKKGQSSLVQNWLSFVPARWPNCHKVLVKTDQTHRKCFFIIISSLKQTRDNMSRQGATAGLGCPLGCLVQRCIFKLINHRCGLKLASVLTLYAHRMVSRQHTSKLWQPM